MDQTFSIFSLKITGAYFDDFKSIYTLDCQNIVICNNYFRQVKILRLDKTFLRQKLFSLIGNSSCNLNLIIKSAFTLKKIYSCLRLSLLFLQRNRVILLFPKFSNVPTSFIFPNPAIHSVADDPIISTFHKSQTLDFFHT